MLTVQSLARPQSAILYTLMIRLKHIALPMKKSLQTPNSPLLLYTDAIHSQQAKVLSSGLRSTILETSEKARKYRGCAQSLTKQQLHHSQSNSSLKVFPEVQQLELAALHQQIYRRQLQPALSLFSAPLQGCGGRTPKL